MCADVALLYFYYITTPRIYDQAIIAEAQSTSTEVSACDCPTEECLIKAYCTCSGVGTDRFAYRDGSLLRHGFLQSRLRQAAGATRDPKHCPCDRLEGIEAVLKCPAHRPPRFISECHEHCG